MTARDLSKWKLCPAMVACDGATLLRGRSVCLACERAEARRGRVIAPRGEHVEQVRKETGR